MSDDDEKTEINLTGLDRLEKAFKKIPVVNVGILGDGSRGAGGKVANNNASIGAVHEFGSVNVPQRSFLRIPLIDHLDKRLKKEGVLSKKSIAEAVKNGSVQMVMAQIGVVAEGIVLEAFDTNGFGKWAPLRPSTLSSKKNQQTLVETGQLRNSITHEVVDGDGED